MPPSTTLIAVEQSSLAGARALRGESGVVRRALKSLEAALGQPFVLLEADTGEIQSTPAGAPGWDYYSRLPVIAAAAERGAVEIVEQESPLSLLAVPLVGMERGAALVAVSVFLTAAVQDQREIAAAARVFGVDSTRAFDWARRADVWPSGALVRLADATLVNLTQQAHLTYLEHEINEAVAHARDTYAELGLLHRLTRRLTLADDDGQLWRRATQWLAESVPAQCLAVVPRPIDDADLDAAARHAQAALQVIQGNCPVAPDELPELLARLGPATQRPLLLNRIHTSAVTWTYPTIRELACTPVFDGSYVEGWLLALNHNGRAGSGVCEFGSAEIRLMESVSTILGVHRGNTGLIHRQADLFGASVRALISAIEAKDRYTLGHSERVARVAACLAERMHLPRRDVNAIYLGGLLHDIGKIGVDDRVLNKPGALTPEEYDQIKQHPRLGYDILRGVRQLDRILPIVLHHHEAWDGTGYPLGLRGEETPLLARVTAVADAFDAMSSDRPYRQGMPDEKLDAIFRDGAGRQWDPNVVSVFFAARDEVRHAAADDAGAAVPLDAASWVD